MRTRAKQKHVASDRARRENVPRHILFHRKRAPERTKQMKKQGPNIIPEDYKKLQEEVLRLKCELKRERLRADFYEEMVAFGKEVYGIDLKKAGTK